MDLATNIARLYREFGPPKPMGDSAPEPTKPHFFLHRNFLGEQDLAILFNTKRCRYQCKFCALPYKSSKDWIEAGDVVSQFWYVAQELKHSLGSLERLTIANEGSVFDETTFPPDALLEIVSSTRALPRIRKLVFETRVEFIEVAKLEEMKAAGKKRLDILTGFETLDETIRDTVLGKRETVDSFLAALEKIRSADADLTAYVLFKPSPDMSDEEAFAEAESSIDFVAGECSKREIPFIIRLNPMYVANGTPWAQQAARASYLPPRLSDVLALTEKKRRQGVRVYVGLTSEGLANDPGTYRAREDFSPQLIKLGIVNNSH